jgi:hypothetical protein
MRLSIADIEALAKQLGISCTPILKEFAWRIEKHIEEQAIETKASIIELAPNFVQLDKGPVAIFENRINQQYTTRLHWGVAIRNCQNNLVADFLQERDAIEFCRIWNFMESRK